MIKYAGNTMKMRLSGDTRTFGDLQWMVAQYFGLPARLIFLSDKPDHGVIYMHEQKVQEELFPMLSARMAKNNPVLYVILQRKMTETTFLNSGQDLKSATKAAVNEVEEVHNLMQDKARQV